MSAIPDVLIIGGGVIGLTTAYYLAREGASVRVVDKGDLGQEASWAGAGIISPGNPKRAKSPIGQLRARSAALFPELSDDLREQTSIDNGYLRCGGLELRQSADALEKKRVENLVREERGEGLDCEVLDTAQLLALEPALTPSLPGAIHYPDMAQVRNPRHLKALVAACAQLGVHFETGCHVHGFDRHGDRIVAAQTAQGSITAGRFLVSGGPWSGLLLDQVRCHTGISPVRGQIALLHTDVPLIRRVIQADARYLVPRPDGRVLVGSTEEDVGFVKRTTAEGIYGLLAFALSVVPELRAAQLERSWAGLRPGSPDGRPFLGQVPGWQNLYIGSGHFRSGLTLSPISGLLLKELLLDQPTSLPLDAFRVDRPIVAS